MSEPGHDNMDAPEGYLEALQPLMQQAMALRDAGKDEEASKVTTTMISEEAAEVRVVDGDLAGRITTSHSATAMRLLTSSLTGRCWRRLTSTAWLS